MGTAVFARMLDADQQRLLSVDHAIPVISTSRGPTRKRRISPVLVSHANIWLLPWPANLSSFEQVPSIWIHSNPCRHNIMSSGEIRSCAAGPVVWEPSSLLPTVIRSTSTGKCHDPEVTVLEEAQRFRIWQTKNSSGHERPSS